MCGQAMFAELQVTKVTTPNGEMSGNRPELAGENVEEK